METSLRNKIAVGIVVYNPDDENRLIQCIHSMLAQVCKVYLFNNGTKPLTVPLPHGVEYFSEHENKGIAYALNRIMERAYKDDYEWVITMDQDSIAPDNLVEEYMLRIGNDSKTAILCPQVIDKRRAYMKLKTTPTEEYVQDCITSGSCTSVHAWNDVGRFDEWLFIDLVDNEFCKRLVSSGYKILQINTAVLNQEFGRIIPKSKKAVNFWIKLSKILNNENVAKFSYRKYVSPMRVYYTNRNIIYVNRKLKNYGPTAYQNYNCKGYFGFVFSFCLPSLLRAQSKSNVLLAIIRGIKDGRKKKVTCWEAKRGKKYESSN